MKRIMFIVALALSLPVFGAQKKYQVTGPILEITDTKIVVQKGKDRWEIDRDAATKISGDLKPGKKVTIEYKMTAANVEVKDEKAKSKKK